MQKYLEKTYCLLIYCLLSLIDCYFMLFLTYLRKYKINSQMINLFNLYQYYVLDIVKKNCIAKNFIKFLLNFRNYFRKSSKIKIFSN